LSPQLARAEISSKASASVSLVPAKPNPFKPERKGVMFKMKILYSLQGLQNLVELFIVVLTYIPTRSEKTLQDYNLMFKDKSIKEISAYPHYRVLKLR
jgi:hypothetical protein